MLPQRGAIDYQSAIIATVDDSLLLLLQHIGCEKNLQSLFPRYRIAMD
jgi:hypothetical protein